jgi:hypothetical protein
MTNYGIHKGGAFLGGTDNSAAESARQTSITDSLRLRINTKHRYMTSTTLLLCTPSFFAEMTGMIKK